MSSIGKAENGDDIVGQHDGVVFCLYGWLPYH